MVIDIISYTDEQFAALSLSKIEEVRAAQLKKNRLEAKLAEDIAKLKRKLIDQGAYHSSVFEKKSAELTTACENEVESIREGLLFYLQFVREEAGEGGQSAPYTVDYSLSEEERMVIVRNYYETTYADGATRFARFKEDEFARSYVGELYAPLYHYFEAQAAA